MLGLLQHKQEINNKRKNVASFSRSLLPHLSSRGLKTEYLKVYAENLKKNPTNFSPTHVRVCIQDAKPMNGCSQIIFNVAILRLSRNLRPRKLTLRKLTSKMRLKSIDPLQRQKNRQRVLLSGKCEPVGVGFLLPLGVLTACSSRARNRLLYSSLANVSLCSMRSRNVIGNKQTLL